MKTYSALSLAVLLVCLSGAAGFCQDDVTISKNRLEELQRKEAELEKLKAEMEKSRGNTEELRKKKEKAEAEREQLQREKQKVEAEKLELQKAKAAAEAHAVAAKPAEQIIARDTPKIETLQPLGKGQVVDAMDLVNHYRAEPAAAAKRYEANRIRVEGEIVALEKPIMMRHFVVSLKSTERDWTVDCLMEPPKDLPVMYTSKKGKELVGSTSSGGAKTVLATVGQRATFEGWCRGLKDQTVTITSARLLGVK